MKDSFSIKYSIRFRIIFLLLTFSLLIVFLLSMQSLVFLILFLNMAYIYVVYLNSPALSIKNGQIHQYSFHSTTLEVENLEEIVEEDKAIIFRTLNEKMVIRKSLIDNDSRVKLLAFLNHKK